MTESTPTDVEAMQRSARVGQSLRQSGIDPATGALPRSRPPADVVQPTHPGSTPAERRQDEGRRTVSIMRQRHEEQQAAYTAFCATVASHFGGITAEQVASSPGMKTSYQLINRMAHDRRAESTRQRINAAADAEPAGPGRDASGRFTRAG